MGGPKGQRRRAGDVGRARDRLRRRESEGAAERASRQPRPRHTSDWQHPCAGRRRLLRCVRGALGPIAIQLRRQVYYSRFIALPPHVSIPLEDTKYDAVVFDRATERTSLENGHADPRPESPRGEEEIELASPPVPEPAGVPPAVLLAHANSITFAMGALTFAVGWIAFPVLHFTGLETFELPPDGMTAAMISLIVLGGVGYNACAAPHSAPLMSSAAS